MASEATAVVTPSTAPPNTPGVHDGLVKSLKRTRETTPTPSPSSITNGDISPAKIARLVGYTRQAQSPEDKRRRIADEHRQDVSATDPDPTNQLINETLLSQLISGAMSRPQDGRPAQDVVEAAAAAASRALQIPSTETSTDLQDVSPQSAVSAETVGTGASVDEGDGHVVHSPGQMEMDAQGHAGSYASIPEAQMEDKSLSYPGLPANSIPPPPQRGMSMPMTDSPNAELGPRSPSSKKHKCPYCETVFTRHHNLKSHLLTHSQEKPYSCTQCEQKFRRLHDLKRHSKLHTGEKPHVCPKCDRKFARGDALARHSKGAGGCAGRRTSMGSFAGEEDYDFEGSTMGGIQHDTSADVSMAEERRPLSMPSIKAQHVAGQAGQEGFTHSNTYPPAGPRPAGGLYPPNVDRGSTASATSPSVPNSHTPHTSISSMPLSAGSSSMYSQSGMTESPKPLSPGAAQVPQAAQKRGPNQAASGLSMPSHGTSETAELWRSQYPPADGRQPEGAPAAPPAVRGRGRGTGSQRQASNGTGANSVSAFTAQDSVWSQIHMLQEQYKQLTADLQARDKREAQWIEKITTQERTISTLAAEVSALQQQLGVSNQDKAAADQE
ncbi:transcriptional regulator prz1 [Echria macrotheca]|uniref:Transcriptional regulator prz1 n=1 Tax=Echria macrotheca TaxID=438768 RepID=A0AAJ0BIB7_9PEZI|nr:transcriptional regulator prz1 [Echria macrotheca]